MNRMRVSELYRYKEQKLINKEIFFHQRQISAKSIKQISLSQSQILKQSKKSHEKAFNFKSTQRSKSLQFANSNIVNRLIQMKNKKSPSLFRKDFNYHSAFKARQTLMKSSMSLTNLRLQKINNENLRTAQKLMTVKSCISSRQMSRDFIQHQRRRSFLSKFKIDTTNFKFIPKNQLILRKLQKAHSSITPIKNEKIRQKVNKAAIFNKYKMNPQSSILKNKKYW